MSEKILSTHLERQAAVYLRQSTLKQVHEHRESTARQYALRQRAIDLGWPSDRIAVVDDDLGQSGSSATWRAGFQRLAEDIALCANVSETPVRVVFSVEGVGRIEDGQANQDRSRGSPVDGLPRAEQGFA
jgi:hypothetical protein